MPAAETNVAFSTLHAAQASAPSADRSGNEGVAPALIERQNPDAPAERARVTLSDAVTALPAVYDRCKTFGRVLSIKADALVVEGVTVVVHVDIDTLRAMFEAGLVVVRSTTLHADGERINIDASGSMFDVPILAFSGQNADAQRWWDNARLSAADLDVGLDTERPCGCDAWSKCREHERATNAPVEPAELPNELALRQFVSTEDDEPITLADLANLNGWAADDWQVLALSRLSLNDTADIGDGGASGSFVFTRVD